MESFFTNLTEDALRGMRIESKEDPKQRIEQYIDRLNEDPVVFKWSYKMGEISVAQRFSCYIGLELLSSYLGRFQQLELSG